jgi:hypothetical protein
MVAVRVKDHDLDGAVRARSETDLRCGIELESGVHFGCPFLPSGVTQV